MLIEVCGTGCVRCQATHKNVLQALKELGVKLGDETQVVEIKDIMQITARGVLMTPAVFIDGVKVCEGRIPGPQEIKRLVEERR